MKMDNFVKIAAILAHEIRNPVSSIAGAAQLIRSDKEVLNNDEQRIKLMGIIERETERLTNLVEEFLVYSGSEKRKNDPVNLTEVLNRSINNIKTNAEYSLKNIKIDFKDQSHDFIMNGDEQRLIQAFDNILLNAVQASPANSTITVQTKEMTEGMFITITDQGVGIPEVSIKEIFEPFFTTKEKGTGLGLAITWNIINAHSGNIEVSNSNTSNGAVFKIFFPRIKM